MDAQLAIDALAMALGRRRPTNRSLYHSDQGCQYASRAYQQVLTNHRIQPSMSRKGNRYDNTCMESFFSSLKNQLVNERRYQIHDEARCDVFEYIKTVYNLRRLHYSFGYVSPVDFEKRYGVVLPCVHETRTITI